jgi:multiple sugar transport system substrate-binding protein
MSSTARDFEFMRLRLLIRPFAPFEAALARQAEAFQELEPDFELELEVLDPPDLYERLSAGADADVALVLTDWIPALASRDRLVPLDSLLSSECPDGWPDAWTPSLRELQQFGGRTFGLAYHDGPMMLLYRRDLFEDGATQRAFQQSHGTRLQVPTTWAEFHDVAAFFMRPEEGLDGATIAAFPDGHNNVYDFLIHLDSRGGQLLRDRQPVFADHIGLESLCYLRDLLHGERPVVSRAVLDMDSVASGEYFAGGHAAMMWNWCGFGAVAQLPGSTIAGKVGFGLIPRGEGTGRHSSLNIYWVMALLPSSRNYELGWRFLRHLATAPMDKVTALCGGTGTRRSTWEDRDVRARFSYYTLMAEAHASAISPPGIVEYPLINDALSDMTASVMRGDAVATDALHEASARVKEILR